MTPVDTIICGDALQVLRTFPDASVDVCCTSPPYFALRSYLPGMHPDKPLEIGTEPSYGAYLSRLCDVFDEVKRVLTPRGSLWVVLGDSYGGDGSRSKRPHKLYQKMRQAAVSLPGAPRTDIPRKSLCLIPFRFAIEMVRRGWICRNVLVWRKPNGLPESVKDRFTIDFEYLFFFSKSSRYYFDQQFEPTADGRGKRNKRAVWHVSTTPLAADHFAAYPQTLVETPIVAGCPPGGTVLDVFVGSGTTALTAKRLGRHYIGIDLNAEYCAMARRRVQAIANG